MENQSTAYCFNLIIDDWSKTIHIDHTQIHLLLTINDYLLVLVNMNNWWGLLWQTRKEGLGNGHNQKKEVLGTGTTLPEKGGLRNGHNQKKGVLGTSRDKKGGSLPWHILVSCVSAPPPPGLILGTFRSLRFTADCGGAANRWEYSSA